MHKDIWTGKTLPWLLLFTISTNVIASEEPPTIKGLSWAMKFDEITERITDLADGCEAKPGLVECRAGASSRSLYLSDTKIEIGCFYTNSCSIQRFELLNAVLDEFDLTVEATRTKLVKQSVEQNNNSSTKSGLPVHDQEDDYVQRLADEITIDDGEEEQQNTYFTRVKHIERLNRVKAEDFEKYRTGFDGKPAITGCADHPSGVKLCVGEWNSITMYKADYANTVVFE